MLLRNSGRVLRAAGIPDYRYCIVKCQMHVPPAHRAVLKSAGAFWVDLGFPPVAASVARVVCKYKTAKYRQLEFILFVNLTNECLFFLSPRVPIKPAFLFCNIKIW